MDLTSAEVESGSAPEASQQQQQQRSKEELENSPAVKSAVTFLNDSRVKRTPVDRKIRFLKGKGLSNDEIKLAFDKCGYTAVTREQISAVQVAEPMQQAAMLGTGGSMAPAPTFSGEAPPRQYSSLFPQGTASSASQEESSATLDWRDVVIGTGVASLVGVAAYKLFNRYSPFEIRRKSDLSGLPPPKSATEIPPRKRAPLPPVPAVPVKADSEELEKLKKELEETKEALAAERKKSADLAVAAAKVRGEKLQVARTNDKLNHEIERLQDQLRKYEPDEEDDVSPVTNEESKDSPEKTDEEIVENFLKQREEEMKAEKEKEENGLPGSEEPPKELAVDTNTNAAPVAASPAPEATVPTETAGETSATEANPKEEKSPEDEPKPEDAKTGQEVVESPPKTKHVSFEEAADISPALEKTDAQPSANNVEAEKEKDPEGTANTEEVPATV